MQSLCIVAAFCRLLLVSAGSNILASFSGPRLAKSCPGAGHL